MILQMELVLTAETVRTQRVCFLSPLMVRRTRHALRTAETPSGAQQLLTILPIRSGGTVGRTCCAQAVRPNRDRPHGEAPATTARAAQETAISPTSSMARCTTGAFLKVIQKHLYLYIYQHHYNMQQKILLNMQNRTQQTFLTM